MKWYNGSIVEAVTLSRKNNSIFVVYIEGQDDKSKKMTELIIKSDVSEVLESSSFVSIKVEANSLAHTQFSEIYKQTLIPSVYFIGKSGAPLKILTEPTDASQLLNIINKIVIDNGGSPLKLKTESLLKHESVSEVVCEGDVCTIKPSTSKTETNNSQLNEEKPNEDTNLSQTDETKADQTAADKLKLAQELIEMKREIKKAEEEETQKQKEVERRKLGQDVQKMKRWQQDQEIKQMMDERQREKREEQAARDRVRRQIEEDKREKAARMSGSISPVVSEQPKARTSNSNTAKLQLKLPDGSVHTHDFPKLSILQEVVDFVKTLNIGFSNFVLSTTFPRREFTANDNSQSLLDLDLVPNAVILVLPVSHGTVATNNSGGGIMGMLWYILAPIISLYGYVKSFIFPTPNNNPPPPAAREKRSNEGSADMSRPMPKRRAGEAAIRRQGNIHRLTDHDSDEDNNTWNGNSTQQM